MTQGDVGNILAGPCRVTIGDMDVGHTVGETRLVITPHLRERRTDSGGETIQDIIHLGENARLTMRVAEWTLDTLSLVYPVSVPDTGGITLGIPPGQRLAALAETMVLHPCEFDDADTSCDITFWKAVAVGAVTVGFSDEKDRLFDVEFLMLPDITRPSGEHLGRMGAS